MMNSEKLALAVDVGTTNVKAALVNECGDEINLSYREMEVVKDSSGRAEHDPNTLFNVFCDVCSKASEGYKDNITTLIISSYQFSILPVDSKMQPLSGIMTLLDTRPQDTFGQLNELVDIPLLYKLTGCPPLFQYPFSKIYWMKKAKPDLFHNARCFLGSKDYLMYRIMGVPYTDASLASSSSLMNLQTLDWDNYPLSVLEIDRSQLPQIVPSDQSIGKIPAAIAEKLGLNSNVQLITGVYDGGAVGIGLGCMDGNTGIINMGTTSMLRAAAKTPVLDENPLMRLQTGYLAYGRWFPGGGINNAGIVLKWLKDNVMAASYESMIDEAASVKTTEGLFCLPFLSGERNPQIGNQASCLFMGMRAHHTRAHVIRAAMEGVSYMLKTTAQSLSENGIKPDKVRVGGGGSRSEFWMKMIASILGIPLQVSSVTEPSLIGSAMIAFTHMKTFGSIEEAAQAMSSYKANIEPISSDTEMYEKNYSFFKYLINHIGNIYTEHSKRGF